MALKAGIISWTSGASDHAETGLGFTPKGLIVFHFTKVGYDGWTAGGMMSVGFASGAGSSAQCAAYVHPVWGTFTPGSEYLTSGGSGMTTNLISSPNYLPGTPIFDLQILSFDADGFTLRPIVAIGTPNQLEFGYLAFGDDDVSVQIGSFSTSGTAADSVATTATPSTLMLIHAANVPMRYSIGWCGAADSNAVSAGMMKNFGAGPANTVSKRYQSTAEAIALLDAAGADVGLGVVTRTPTGFDVAWSTVPSAGVTIRFMALTGINAHVGAFIEPGATGVQTIPTSMPVGSVVFQSVGQAAGSGIQNDARLMLGLGDISAEYGGLLADNNNTSYANRRTTNYLSSTSIALGSPTSSSAGTADALAAIDSFGASSLGVNWSARTSGLREIIFVAFSPSTIKGSFVAGVKTTVRATRSAAFGLDGNTNVHDEAGKLKIFGNFEVTSNTTLGRMAGDPSSLVDGDIWYNSVLNQLRARVNGVTVSLVGLSAPTYERSFSLTHAEILALPTTYIEVVPDPGANKFLVFDDATIYFDVPGGVYTNVDTVPLRGIAIFYGDWVQEGSLWYPWGGGGEGAVLRPSIFPLNHPTNEGFYPVQGGWVSGSTNLKIGAWNDVGGNYTGGHASNSLKGIVRYRIFDYSLGAYV